MALLSQAYAFKNFTVVALVRFFTREPDKEMNHLHGHHDILCQRQARGWSSFPTGRTCCAHVGYCTFVGTDAHADAFLLLLLLTVSSSLTSMQRFAAPMTLGSEVHFTVSRSLLLMSELQLTSPHFFFASEFGPSGS